MSDVNEVMRRTDMRTVTATEIRLLIDEIKSLRERACRVAICGDCGGYSLMLGETERECTGHSEPEASDSPPHPMNSPAQDAEYQLNFVPPQQLLVEGIQSMINGAVNGLMVNLGHSVNADPMLSTSYGEAALLVAIQALIKEE